MCLIRVPHIIWVLSQEGEMEEESPFTSGGNPASVDRIVSGECASLLCLLT